MCVGRHIVHMDGNLWKLVSLTQIGGKSAKNDDLKIRVMKCIAHLCC